MGKSFFEKMGLVESVHEATPPDVEYIKEDVAPIASVPDPVMFPDAGGGLSEQIYATNDLIDRDRSIYKVDELIKSLPMEMMEKTKKDTVANLLKVLLLTVPELVSDAEKRKSVLTAKLNEICNSNTAVIEQSKQDIEDLKAAISAANQAIDEKEKEVKFATEAVEKECAIIDSLIEFIGGKVNVA